MKVQTCIFTWFNGQLKAEKNDLTGDSGLWNSWQGWKDSKRVIKEQINHWIWWILRFWW